MKKENKQIFEKHFQNLSNGTFGHYVRNVHRYDMEELNAAYIDEGNKDILVGRNITCASCVVEFYEIVGKWYFNEIKKENEVLTASIIKKDKNITEEKKVSQNANKQPKKANKK